MSTSGEEKGMKSPIVAEPTVVDVDALAEQDLLKLGYQQEMHRVSRPQYHPCLLRLLTIICVVQRDGAYHVQYVTSPTYTLTDLNCANSDTWYARYLRSDMKNSTHVSRPWKLLWQSVSDHVFVPKLRFVILTRRLSNHSIRSIWAICNRTHRRRSCRSHLGVRLYSLDRSLSNTVLIASSE